MALMFISLKYIVDSESRTHWGPFNSKESLHHRRRLFASFSGDLRKSIPQWRPDLVLQGE